MGIPREENGTPQDVGPARVLRLSATTSRVSRSQFSQTTGEPSFIRQLREAMSKQDPRVPEGWLQRGHADLCPERRIMVFNKPLSQIRLFADKVGILD